MQRFVFVCTDFDLDAFLSLLSRNPPGWVDQNKDLWLDKDFPMLFEGDIFSVNNAFFRVHIRIVYSQHEVLIVEQLI